MNLPNTLSLEEHKGKSMTADGFDCDRDCPQHGRNDQRITNLEKTSDANATCVSGLKTSLTDRDAKIWGELDNMKSDAVKEHADLQRRLGESVKIRHAITGVIILVGIMTTLVTITITSNGRIEDKLDAVVSDVAVLKAVAEERQIQNDFRASILQELRQFREQEKQPDEETTYRLKSR